LSTLPRRMLWASLLHADTYEEVEADRSSMAQALLIVMVACAAGGVSSYALGSRPEFPTDQMAMQIALAVIEPLILWVGGAAFAYMVGSSFFRGTETETDFAEVLRTTGFAFAPAWLRLLSIVPPPTLGLSIDLAARIWVFVAVVIAIRQALDFTTPRAAGTFGLAAILLWLVAWGLTVAPLPF
jgi:hypothetical protein